MASGEPIGKPLVHQDEVVRAVFSPDGTMVVTASKDQTAQLWEVSTTDPLGEPLAHRNQVRDVAFAPDGKRVVTASEDRTCQVWDVATCRPLGPAIRHRESVSSLAWSPDGRRLITGSRDKTACVWDLPEPVDANAKRLTIWIQTLCGMELAGNDALGLLSPEEWRKRARELEQLGGPPIAQ